MTKELKYIILLIAAIPLLASCNNKDDLDAIFVGRTWYVINFNNDNKGNSALSSEQFNKLYQQSNTYCIRFTTTGKCTITTAEGSSFETTCTIDGDKQTIKFDINQSSPDEIGAIMLDWLQKTSKYKGDTNVMEFHQQGNNKFIALGAEQRKAN